MSAHERIEVPDCHPRAVPPQRAAARGGRPRGSFAARERDASAASGGARPIGRRRRPAVSAGVDGRARSAQRFARGARVPERRGQARRWGLSAAVGVGGDLDGNHASPPGHDAFRSWACDHDRFRSHQGVAAVAGRLPAHRGAPKRWPTATSRARATSFDSGTRRRGSPTASSCRSTAAVRSRSTFRRADIARRRSVATARCSSTGRTSSTTRPAGSGSFSSRRSSLRVGADHRGGAPRGRRRSAIAARDAPDPARALAIQFSMQKEVRP